MDDLEKIAQETIERVQQRIYKKIPELGQGWTKQYISLRDLKRLNEEEFILLWDLGIEILHHWNAKEYIDDRKRQLGLLQDDQLPSKS